MCSVMFLISNSLGFSSLNISSSFNIHHFTSQLWITLDCYLIKLLSKKILNLHKLTFALPQDVKSSHVDSTKILSFEIEMNLRLRQAVACIYLFLTQVMIPLGKSIKEKEQTHFLKILSYLKTWKKRENFYL